MDANKIFDIVTAREREINETAFLDYLNETQDAIAEELNGIERIFYTDTTGSELELESRIMKIAEAYLDGVLISHLPLSMIKDII